MTVSKNDINVVNRLDVSSSWKDIASVINFGTDVQREGFRIAVQKGAEEGLYASELINVLRDNGCTLSKTHIEFTLSYFEFKLELSKSHPDGSSINIPETERQFRSLPHTSPQEDVEVFNEIAESVGKSQPSAEDIRAHKKVFMEVKNSIGGNDKEDESKKKSLYLSYEQTEQFRAWLKETHNIDAVNDKPKVNMLELSSLRNDILNDLASRVPEWKQARKITIKLLHPDSGGNTLAYQFFEAFDELMSNLVKAYEHVEFQNKIEKYKKEWWELKQ